MDKNQIMIDNISRFYFKMLKAKNPNWSDEELEEKTNSDLVEIIDKCFKKERSEE